MILCFVSLVPTPYLSVTFSFHLFLFPVGLTSRYLCFRVATAALWIMETPHPHSKQHTEAQMLTHKHTFISASNLQWANRRWRRLLSHLHGSYLFTCTITYSAPCNFGVEFVVIMLYCGCIRYSLLTDEATGTLCLIKPVFKGSRCCPSLCPAGQIRSIIPAHISFDQK